MKARHGSLLCSLLAALAWSIVSLTGPAGAQAPDIARAFAPTGTLRVGVLMVSYFAIEESSGTLNGVVPDLGRELARRLGVPAQLIKFDNPIAVIEAFRKGELDVTFIGITADRAAAFHFATPVLNLQTTYLVPASSTIARIAEIDQAGVRLLVPARSAQEAYLKQIIRNATMISVPVENPKQAVEKLAAGEADAFSHVVPMLVSAQRALPGSRILPGSYYNVPIAIGFAKERPAAVGDYAKQFAEDVKTSGFVQRSLERAGDSVKGVVVASHIPPVELKVLSSNGTSAIVQALGAEFERRTGHKLTLKIDVAALLHKEIEAGETFDVAVLTRSVIGQLVEQGKVDGATGAEIARSGIGVAIRAGAPKPDISTPEAFKRTMLEAKSIAYTTVGGSGIHFMNMAANLGIADAVKAKGRTQTGGLVAELVARGEAELAVQQISEILPVAGVDLVGPFPPELQLITPFSAGMSVHAKNREAAQALIKFFSEPEALRIIKAKGMEPR